MCIYFALYTNLARTGALCFDQLHILLIQPASGRTRLKEWRMLARHGGKIKFDRCTDTTGYFLGNRVYRRELTVKEWYDDPVRPIGPISLVKSEFSSCVYQGGGLENPVRQASWASRAQN